MSCKDLFYLQRNELNPWGRPVGILSLTHASDDFEWLPTSAWKEVVIHPCDCHTSIAGVNMEDYFPPIMWHLYLLITCATAEIPYLWVLATPTTRA